MATISSSQAHTSLTPPSSSHGQDSWNYSVPVEPTSPSAVTDYHNHNRQISQTNGNPLRPSTETFGPPLDHNHLAPARANELNRQNSDISDTPSAPDSLLDSYGNNKGGRSMDSGGKKGMNGGTYEMDDVEHSRWIHRDKLARIENEELQAAGIPIPRPRTGSKSNRRDRSQDASSAIRSEGQKRQKMGVNGDGEGNPWDLRLPEESAGDLGTKGISKIPISKTSPLPIPIDYLERDTPVARKASNNWYDEEDPLSFKQARSRSHSVKSSLMLDDATPSSSNAPMPTPARVSPTPTSARASPSERSPAKKAPGRKGSVGANAALPGGRQTSAQRQKQKPSGTNAPDIRPKTRSGDLINTSKRPEGDPPWLATMYKPDPRLPPDQQVIPTHAKRMQQEQWQKEGKYGTVYDTDFRPLNQQEYRARPDSFSPPPEGPDGPDGPEEPKSEEQAPEWPLSNPQSPSPVSPVSPVSAMTPKSPTLSTGPRSPVERASSYSTMPKIATGKPQGVNIPDPKPPIRVQDSPESSKGCGCCVIM